MNGDVCRKSGCKTIVSKYSTSDLCYIHTKERNATSDRFIQGIRGTYDLTPEELMAEELRRLDGEV